MDEWSKMIWVSVDLMAAALILVSALTITRISRDFGRMQQREIDAITITKLYRTYNKYETDEYLAPQDIISLIFETRGRPEVWVDSMPGTGDANTLFSYVWDTSHPPTSNMWDLTHISENILPVSAPYKATIIKNDNGEISRIEFRRH